VRFALDPSEQSGLWDLVVWIQVQKLESVCIDLLTRLHQGRFVPVNGQFVCAL
jgi:hypothetical protein